MASGWRFWGPGGIALFLLVWSGQAPASNERTCYGRSGSPDIKGLYDDDFGGYHVVGAKVWVSGSADSELIFHYCEVQNAESLLTAQNDAGNPFSPNSYSRFEWTTHNGATWYCQQVYDAPTDIEAADTSVRPKADATDPSAGGCGVPANDFAWTKLIPK